MEMVGLDPDDAMKARCQVMILLRYCCSCLNTVGAMSPGRIRASSPRLRKTTSSLFGHK